MGVRTVVRLAAPTALAHWVQALISSIINIIIVAFPAGRLIIIITIYLFVPGQIDAFKRDITIPRWYAVALTLLIIY